MQIAENILNCSVNYFISVTIFIKIDSSIFTHQYMNLLCKDLCTFSFKYQLYKSKLPLKITQVKQLSYRLSAYHHQ